VNADVRAASAAPAGRDSVTCVAIECARQTVRNSAEAEKFLS